MRYFLDTEFIETQNRVDLVSVGVVADDGREFYAISTEFDPGLANAFVADVVLPLLEPRDHPAWRSRADILTGLVAFVGDDRQPVFWTWGGAAYDWWAVVQLFPLAERVPDGWKYSAYDVMQLVEANGLSTDPLDPGVPPPPDDGHHALVDARWTRQCFLHATGAVPAPGLLRPLVLTGGPAVGKTTTGRALAQSRDRGAFVDVDDVRQLVVAGGQAPWAGDEGLAQQMLGVENACALARRFLDHGMDVVIADVVTPRTAAGYRTMLPGCVLVHLRLPIARARERSATRPRWITDDEFDNLHRLEIHDPPRVDVGIDVGELSEREQVAAIAEVWACYG